MTTARTEIRSAEIRRVRSDDVAAMQAFVDGLGGASRRWRFHGGVARCSARLAETLVGLHGAPASIWLACDGAYVVGEARLVRDAGDPAQAELALSVADDWQGRGLAGALLQTLVDAARRSGVQRLVADVMDDNERMQRFLRRHGFVQPMRWNRDEGLQFELALRPAGTLMQRLAARVAERVGV